MPSWSRIVAISALAGLATVVGGAAASAQTPSAQPYASLQIRMVKALSDEQIGDLAAGRGMGLALAAELNGYPGPSHVLELADQLGLSEQQRTSVKGLFEAMKAEAVPRGQKLIAAETDLDRQFAERTITADRLKAATAAIGEIRGALRNTHLKYHLATAALLKTDQINRYAELRGYTNTPGASATHSGPANHGMPMHGATGGAMHQHMGPLPAE